MWLTLLLLLVVHPLEHVTAGLEEQAKIYASNGHIIFEPAMGKNITFSMQGAGYVNVGSHNLHQMLQTIAKMSPTESPRSSPPDNGEMVKHQEQLQLLTTYITGPFGLLARLADLELDSTAHNATRMVQRIGTLTRDVMVVEVWLGALKERIRTDHCASGPCQNGGTCIRLYNSFQCLCRSGWQGRTCAKDVNECAQLAGTELGCQNGATCQNRPGGYSCLCADGWRGIHCVARTQDCAMAGAELCGNGICVQLRDGGYRCACEPGWKTNGLTPACTVDVDECGDGPGAHCWQDAEPVRCINLPGSFTCGPCPAGYTGTGFYCTDIDECDTDNGGCSTAPSVACINTRGSFRCGSCPAGYAGDGRTCVAQALPHCIPGQCHPMARCVDSGTVPGCVCLPGYTGSGYGSLGCAPEPTGCASAPCQNGGTCVVTNETSYRCLCPAGTDPPHCATVSSPCDSNPCQNGGTCDRWGHQHNRHRLVCRCPPGYTGLHCQTPVQACDGERYQLAGDLHYPDLIGEEMAPARPIRCAWLIRTNETFTLHVTFSEFEMVGGGCRNEWLQIHDGHSAAAPTIGRYCGSELPNGDGHLTSTSSTLYIWYHSQIVSPYIGFRLHWESVEPVCGGRMTVQDHGTLQWPDPDDRHRQETIPGHWACKWQLQTEPGRRLQFTFVRLLMPDADCDRHFVRLTEGIDEDKGTVLANYCSQTVSHSSATSLTTAGSGATLYFHSDAPNHDVSFSIRYTVVQADCGGILTQLVGTIDSSRQVTTAQTDDDDDDQHRVCEYRISLPVGTRVEIRFPSVLLEPDGQCSSSRGQVELYDGSSATDPSLGRFCDGQPPPASVTSTTNVLLVRFHHRTRSGFRVSYAMKCGGTFTNSDLPLFSPGYPRLYPAQLQCDYLIHAPLGQIVTFDFADLDLGEGDTGDCSFGYVELRDGLPQSGGHLLGGGCRRSMPKQIRSSGNVLRLRLVFYGRRSASARGFKARFRFLEIGCGGVLTRADTVIHSPAIAETTGVHYQPAWKGLCVWILAAPVGHTILLRWNSFELVDVSAGCQHQYVAVYDDGLARSSTSNGLVGRYCGSQRPPTMTSATELLTIRFVTEPTMVAAKDSFAFEFSFIEVNQSCGGSYSGTNGIIQSPGWPNAYAPNRNCVWTIEVPMGLQIRLLVRTFSLEQQDRACWFDGLTIRNGGTDQSPLIGTYCGDRRGEEFNGTISSGHQLYLHFYSDGTGSERGFELEWDASTTGCGGILTAPYGTIISPNYPLAYGHNGSCSWRIIVSQGSTVRITLTSLHLGEDGDRCRHDYLDVYDGEDAGGHRIGRFCGRPVAPALVYTTTTTTNHAYLRLQSTDTYQGEGGFRLDYGLVCRQNNITTGRHRGVLESPNFPDRYPSGLDCQWSFVVPRGNRIRLEFPFFAIESLYSEATGSTESQHCPYDYLEVRQREPSSSSPVDPMPVTRRYCTAPPRTFVSLGNTIEVLFHSASSSSNSSTVSTGERFGFRLEWSIEGCGGLLDNHRHPRYAQEFHSPGYPHSYPRDTECVWEIATEPGYRIMLSFEELRLLGDAGCRSDGVMVANDAAFRQLITTICHERTEAPLQVVSTGHQLYVKFWSSESPVASRGFRARYIAESAACGGTYILHRGVITSPNYPAPYPVNVTCEWLILTELSHTLQLTFEDLVLEPSDNCTNDAVMVYDGIVPESEHLLLVACGTGSTSTTSVSSIQHGLLVTFRSNELYSYKGFRASYVTNCGAQIVAKRPGTVKLDTAHMLVATRECSWVLTAPEETERITLSFVHVSIGDHETADSRCNVSMEVLDGDASTSGAVRYTGCGYHVPAAIVSSGNALTVRIRSGDVSLTELNNLFLEFSYTTLENACGGRLDALTGLFASPNYPRSYPANVECVWMVRASPGNRIRLEIRQLDIVPTEGCNGDYLEVRESDVSGRLLGDFCGTVQPEGNLSAVGGMWIKFRSSGPTVANGFLAHYAYESLTELDGSDGTITSPLYPRSYYELRRVGWRVSVPEGSGVAISFNQFAIDHSSDLPDLCDGSLRIYDGYDDEAPVLLTACGYVKPEPLTSSTNVVYIELDHRHARGPSNFSLHWQQRVLVAVSQQPTSTACDNGHQRLISLDAVGIAYNVTSPGFPYGYAPDLACSWIMQSAIASYHPVLRLVVVDLEETSECLADYVEVASSSDLAQWQPFGRICRYGENREGSETTAQDAFAGKPHLRLSFRTDYYHNRTGFAATVQLACGSYLTAPNGVIELEPEDQNRTSGTPWALGGCSWNVSVRAGRQIEFEQLTLSEGTVTIRNGIDERAPVIGVYGGGTEKLSPGLLHTTGNRAFVHYQLPGAPEGGSRRVEFRLLYRELSLECGATVWLDRHYNTTTLQTPNYPSAPPPFLDCVWKIMVAAGHLLRLDLLDVDSFLYRQECDHRYLQVLDGPTDRGPELLNTCHSFPSAARTLYSTTDGMRLRYFVERQPDDRQPKPLQFRVSLVNCGRSSYSARGTITSAHYPLPGAYPAPAVCEYNINPPTLASLQLTFTDLHLPGNPAHHPGCTDTDSVRLYGIMWGSNGSVQLPLGTFCGTTVPPAPIESPTAHVLVSFRTLQSNHSATEYRGFRLTYRTKPNNCVHRIEAPSGVVANPGYDTQLAPQKHCVWEITVPVGRRVKIEFLDLDPTLQREYHPLVMFYDGFTMSKRNRDYVRIPYGIPASDGGLPAPIYTSSNELAIRYFSLRDIIGRGIFKVRFSSDEATVCVGNLNGPGGTIETPANASTLVCSYGRTDRTLGSPGDRGTLALSFREVVVKGPLDGASCIEIVGASGKSLLRKLCSSSSRKQVILSPFTDTAITLMRGRVEGERLGFKMDYRVHECGGRYAGARGGGAPTNISHSSSSSTGEHRCGWQVLYPVGTLVEIRVVRFDLRLPCPEEYLVLYNGPLPTSPRIGRYCKDAPIVERTIATHRHELYVEYHAGGPTAGSFELQLGGKPFGCGGTLHSGTPTFGSPIMSDASNRTTTYPPNVECVWLLQTQLGQQIGVSFVERFSIEKSPDCTKDYLELFDQPVRGEWISLGRVCGKTPIPGVFNSTGPTLKVVFRTDNATESDGFTIRWDVNCGGVFYAEEEPQLIVSPNFPEPYSPNQHCSYTIVASNGTDRHIELSFGSFQLAAISPVQSCQSTDNLTLYRRDEQSPDPNAWQTAGTYCGAVGPMSTFRALDRARVVFRSDRSREGPGFVFEFQLGSCGGNVTGSQRIQSPVSGPLPEGMSHRAGSPLHCRWYLAIPPGRKVTVRFERLDLRHSTDCREDAIEVYRGLELTRSNRLAVLCGNLTGHAPAVPISGSHGIISFRMGPQQQQQQNRKSSSKSSKSVPPLVALILYGPDCDRSITLDDRSPRYELRAEGGGEAQDCHYTFEAPTGYTVLVTFEHFQLNTTRNGTASCSDDYVELHDGLSALAPLLGRYCGTRVPSAQASSGPWLHLRYVTDSALRDMRLEATITMEPSLCGSLEHDLTSSGEVIVSAPPANTDHPASIQRCLWVFRAAPDHQIELQFLKFDLTSNGEDADGCINYIGIRDSTHQPIIYEGLGETLVYHGRNTSFPRFSHGISYPTAYHKYCGGSYVPSPYHSLTNEVFVELQRESSKASGSAVLSVRQSGACDQHYTGLQGRIMRTTVPVRGQRPCTITIEVPENYTVAVYFNRFKLEQAVAHECAAKNAGVRVYNGTSERAEHLLAVYCGAVTPNPIFATGQALRFVLPDADNAASLLLDATYVANNWGPGCGGVLYNYGGVLTSPFYPASNNRTPVNCWWMVTVPDNLVVALSFEVFELGSDSSCTTDYLKVTEYIEMEDGALGMDHSIVFCDDNYPGIYVLKTNEVRLFYRRSSRFDGVGFMLRFMAVEPDSFQRRG